MNIAKQDLPINPLPPGVVAFSDSGPTELGPVWVAVSEHGLAGVGLKLSQEAFEEDLRRHGYRRLIRDSQSTAFAFQQIEEYLDGKRTGFQMSIDWSGLTAFQKQVLQATSQIPYGQVKTYGELARGIGRPGAARAVGRAEATNPFPLVIPCHRVLGSDGKLHGYGGGGIQVKAWLLNLEQTQVGLSRRQLAS
jgi:methylated-DNA-[protein]-cysteine S-methyltransferase